MIFRVKYSLDGDGGPLCVKFIKALTPSTAKDMVLAHWEEKGYRPVILDVSSYDEGAHRWESLAESNF